MFPNREVTLDYHIYDFEGHGSSAFDGIFRTASRTEPTVTTKWNKLKSTTGGTAVHGTTKSWIPAVNHSVNVLDDRFTRM